MNDRSTLEEEILVEALALPAEARRTFIERRCGLDHPTAGRLLTLVQGYQENSAFLETPAPAATLQSVGRTFGVMPSEPQPGDRIHRYHLVKRIGEGGFGVVYLAEQEEPVQRPVALKVIRLGLDTREFIARFEAERQVLAVMDHPNIARVFDAGATDSGRPYLVMELIRGIPITAYCDEHRLPIVARLGLFLQVCSAIQHAHQKGIIHRDLKPSNLLIELNDPPEAGCPKVIDFGIAKAAPDRLTKKTLFTRFHALVGTPAYTSPEQMEMSGLDVDTRSDIYSLGVLLYELLAGCQPFERDALEGTSLEEMRRVIREVDPPRPSLRVSGFDQDELSRAAQRRGVAPDQLAALLRSDLDWIVMRCLEKDRTRRYETANGLAMDLRRHLENQPVIARPPTRAYRYGKFVRRNRTWVIAGSTMALAVTAGLALASVGFARARVQQHATEAARRDSQDLVSFMLRDLRPELQQVGRLPLTTQVAERAVNYFSKLPPDLNNAATERNRAIALEGLAYARAAAGHVDATISLWREALEARRRAAAGAADNPLFAVELALTEFVEESRSAPLISPYAWGSGSAEVDARLSSIVQRARAAARAHRDDGEVTRGLAQVLAGYSTYLNTRVIHAEAALAVGREAEVLYRGLLEQSPADAVLGAEHVRVMMGISVALQQAGDTTGGIRAGEAALALADRELARHPGNIELRENAAHAAMQLCYRQGDLSLEAARAAGATARERWRALHETDPQNFSYRYRYAWAHHLEADLLYAAGRKAEAGAFAERFANLLAPVAQSGPDCLELRLTFSKLAACSAQLGEHENSRKHLALAHEWHRRYLATFAPGVVHPLSVQLGYFAELCGSLECVADWPELERQARKFLAAIAGAQGADSPPQSFSRERANAGYFIGRALLHQGRASDAIPHFRDAWGDSATAHAAPRPAPAPEGWSVYMQGGLAEALVACGEFEQARVELEKNIAAWERLVAAHPMIPWDWRVRRIEMEFLLASVLDSVDEAPRQRELLDRGSAILRAHATETRLSVPNAELLQKIEALRLMKSMPPPDPASANAPAL